MRARVTPHAQSTRDGQDGSRNAGSNGHPQHHASSIAAAPRPDNHVAPRWDNPSVPAGDIELLRRAWDAYARGDIDAATAVLHPQVRWCAAEEPDAEGNCHDRDQAVAFIHRSLADGVSAEALDFRDAGDRVVVVVQTHQPPEWGDQPEPHGEVVTVRDGKVVEMLVYPTVKAALAAAGTE
jgi:ketosteroid isomerase-like protein